VGCQSHAPTTLPPRKNGYALYRRLGRPQKCGKTRPLRVSIPGPSSPWRVAIPTELSRPSSIKIFTLMTSPNSAVLHFALLSVVFLFLFTRAQQIQPFRLAVRFQSSLRCCVIAFRSEQRCRIVGSGGCGRTISRSDRQRCSD
jgi:hypothetical protein